MRQFMQRNMNGIYVEHDHKPLDSAELLMQAQKF